MEWESQECQPGHQQGPHPSAGARDRQGIGVWNELRQHGHRGQLGEEEEELKGREETQKKISFPCALEEEHPEVTGRGGADRSPAAFTYPSRRDSEGGPVGEGFRKPRDEASNSVPGAG